MKKLLSILATFALASTSTMTVVSWTITPKTNDSEVITNNSLEQLIVTAQALATNEKSKPHTAYQKLHKAIGQARGTLKIYINENENPGVLYEAYLTLQAAMNTFTATDNELAKIDILETRIVEAHGILEKNNDKLEQEKVKLLAVIKEADDLVGGKPPRNDQNKVDQTLLKLQTAMISFLNSTNEIADYSRLNAEIKKAQQALNKYPNKHPGVIKSLNDAIANAQKVIEQSYTTNDQGIVDQEVKNLKAAIANFLDAGKAKANTDELAQIIFDSRKIPQGNKSKAEWLVFQQAIEHAQGVVKGQPTIDQQHIVDQEVKHLKKAKEVFNNTPDQNADLTWLKSNIAMAKTIGKKNKREQDWLLFQSAITKAENYVLKPPLIDQQSEVDQMTEDLWEATYDFLNKADRTDIRSAILWKTSIGSLKDDKHETIKKALETKYAPLKEGKDYKIGAVKDYNGKFGVELTGINDYFEKTVVTFVLDIQNIEYDLYDLANSKQTQLWTASELQTAIENKNFDIQNALKVTEIAYEPTLNVKRFKITANDLYDYSNYKGEIIINQVLNRENQDKTIYLDPNNGAIKAVVGSAPKETKEVINIGRKGGYAQGMPKNIEKVPNYISPKITRLDWLFQGATKFNGDISKWDTKNVTNMDAMFNIAPAFNQDLSEWNVSKVKSFSWMFGGAIQFNGDISTWNTKNATNMDHMFVSAKNFDQDISTKILSSGIKAWDTSKVINMDHMFNEARVFNQDISSWNTGNVTNMNAMFYNARSFNQDLNGWDVEKVTNHSGFNFGTPAWKLPKPKFPN
ncbi:BspA family leucine-rich repeat surface protein [Williamsoniiplasma lucivorax]|uniref:BspA family leucine-rich repeat surface protein n=1 Tax=Williamsoniiplasma lucivorax TaxID=209274 RepID=A0A2S5RD53_9MOLU|nr:BspA family leucine-rich repeat surface protein [Williamsoniiplasma lucivorax]PPE05132.1 hypothetical protein ELUCI_v1c06680 [Williamsoniiplasma lucivorax]